MNPLTRRFANGQCPWIADRTSQVFLDREIHRNGPWLAHRIIPFGLFARCVTLCEFFSIQVGSARGCGSSSVLWFLIKAFTFISLSSPSDRYLYRANGIHLPSIKFHYQSQCITIKSPEIPTAKIKDQWNRSYGYLDY
jgi:hypothetical protein